MAHSELQSKEPYAPYRFTVDEYYRMVDADILKDTERVELLDGRVMIKELPGPPHAGHVDLLTGLLTGCLRERAHIRIQSPLHVDVLNHPEPDLAVLCPRDDFYMTSHPRPDEALLVIEVGWSSASADREVKEPLYARAGIRDFWIVDIRRQLLQVYRDPGLDGFRETRHLDRSETVIPLAFPDVAFAVADLIRPVPET